MFLGPVLVAASLALTPAQALWPAPRKLSTGTDVLFIDQTINVTYNGQPVRSLLPPASIIVQEAEIRTRPQLSYAYGHSPPPGPTLGGKDVVQAGLARALAAIFQHNFVPWKLRPRHSDFEPDVNGGAKKWLRRIEITQTASDGPSTPRPRAGDVDESYSLRMSGEGDVQLGCVSSTGCLHGLETLSQLFFQHSSGTFWYTPHAPVDIEDAPEFAHRGLLLDVARNWLPVEDIRRTIDALAWNKMNRLHLHITDSQSWPLEIPALPELAAKGAYRRGLSYSPADVAALYEYGAHRGVEVVMEVDMPGHIGVVDLAYKDLIVAYNEKPYQQYCAEPPCGAFRMNSSDVYGFLDSLLDDLLPRIAPYSAYFHTGGDELNKNDYVLDPGVGSNNPAVIRPLLQKFLDFVHAKVRKAGLTPLVWEEMVTDWNQSLGDDVVVQSWLGDGAVKKLAEAGHKVVDSNYNFWYLDCGRGQWLNFDNGPAFEKFYPFNDWCGPTKNWRLVYSHDPRAGLSRQAAARVLGGEVAVWSEMVDSSNLDGIVLPRASAAAEVLWSGRRDAAGRNRSQYDAAPRLAELRERMLARGVAAPPVQMIFCTQADAAECAQVV